MTCHVLQLNHGNQHSQHPKKDKKQSEKKWYVTESSRLKRYRKRVNYKSFGKKKKKGVEKKKLLDTPCENINTVVDGTCLTRKTYSNICFR